MTDFRNSRHAEEWDGFTERRAVIGAQVADGSGDPSRPVTKAELQEALREHRHSTREFIATKFTELEELIRDGFPNGDTRGHREVHEGSIKRAEERSKLWTSVREKLVSGGVMTAAGFIVVALWNHFVNAVQQGPK